MFLTLTPNVKSIVSWEMVTSNGTIVNVNASEDPGLAIALRGSGSQLGKSRVEYYN